MILTLVAKNQGKSNVGNISDVQVDISLPAGLTYTSHTAPTGTSYDSSTRIWTIGNWEAPVPPTYTMTLTATRAANAVLNKQCVTAELSAKPPEPIDKTVDNRSTVCLGDESSIVFGSGEADILTPFNCVSQTQYPCDSSDSLEVVVSGYSTTTSATLDLDETIVTERLQGIVGRWRQPESVVIQVKDPRARVAPVSGTGSVWSTGKSAMTGPFGSVFSIFAFPASGFSNYRFGINKTAGNGYVRIYAGTTLLLDSENQTSLGPLATVGTTVAFVEFEKLGTYTFDLTMSAQHASGDCDTDGNNINDSFCDTETYTFHVGPVAELAVQDAGPNPALSPSQRAFTIAAVNTGPDNAPAAKVTVDLQGASVSEAIASQGSYSNGVWTIGNLSVNGPTIAPILTLITDDVATDITATITNTQDYGVCIGSSGSDLDHDNETDCEAVTGASWHTAKYYDYKSANNTATVTAQAGTRGPTASITVEWTTPADVTVSRYQVWRQGSPWKLIAEVEAGETSYTDTTAEPGRAYLYMVRALDAQGIPVSSQTLVAAPQTGGQGGGDGSGGSTRPPPTDHHGNSPATATPLAPTARVGGFLHAGDQDYFRLVLPHAGLLYVETTGWSNTVGTVWQGGRELGSAELGGRLYNFRLGVPVQPGPVIIRVAERSRTAFGTYRLYTRFIAGQVDQPPPRPSRTAWAW